jgi:hypothetical protein
MNAGDNIPTVDRPDYLDATRIDDLARMLLELTSEVWALRDRNVVLERLLSEHGVLTAGEVDAYQPDEQLASELLTQRRSLIRRVLGAALPSDERTAAALRDQ